MKTIDKKNNLNNQIVTIKTQFLSALIFSIIIELTNIFVSGGLDDSNIENWISNLFAFVFLWQIVIKSNRVLNKVFPIDEKPKKNLIINIVLAYFLSIPFTIIVEFILSFIYSRDMPLINEIMGEALVTFLIIALMSSVVNMLMFFKAYEKQGEMVLAERQLTYLRQMLENVEDVIQVLDITGAVKYSSPSIYKILGFTPEEVLSHAPLERVHPDDRIITRGAYQKLLKMPGNDALVQFRVITKTGEIKIVEAKMVNALANPEIEGFIATIRDVSQTVDATKRLQRQAETYELLLNMSKSFLKNDFQNTLELMLEDLGRFAGVERTYVYQLNQSRDYLNCLFEWRSEKGASVKSLFYETGLAVERLAWVVNELDNGKIIAISDIEDMPLEAEGSKRIFESDGTKSILLIPMMVKNSLIGFIGYDSLFVNKTWGDEEVRTLSIFNEIVTSALSRKESEIKTRDSLSLLQNVIESTADGIMVADLNDHIILHNRAFVQLCGLSDLDFTKNGKSTVIERLLENVENKQELINEIQLASSQQGPDNKLTAYMKDKRVLEIISAPQKFEAAVNGNIWSVRDITSRINSVKEKIEKGVAQAQFESLKNQVNPHFLFNSLNVLTSLVHIDPNLSERFINELAKSYRYLLEQKDNELVDLKTEIDFVKAFTFLLKIRFEDKLQLKIDLKKAHLSYQIAPLTLQLLIENAVKHNSFSQDEPLKIGIHVEDENVLVVENNLQMRIQSMPSTRVGQSNIINRYKLITDRLPEFSIEKNKYVARIPLLKNN
ncbi:MAG: PAS domain S-box protein [Fulvivirga sp.]|uniref:PAS domain S-box protein n=1 Tax=Fulvivirga sp. TaxID=1931237 RepID=UPI0032EB39A6